MLQYKYNQKYIKGNYFMEKKKRRVRKPDWFKVTYDSEVGVIAC